MIVYYVVGRPRSGSTFVGDWIARRLAIINAGEVWQTMRAVEAVELPGFDDGGGRWSKTEARAEKKQEILDDPFWSRVFSLNRDDPYAALIETVETEGDALVDCSKTDMGIERYNKLGCEVVVIHTVRAYSTWVRSVMRYRSDYGIARHGRLRLLASYVRNNLRLARLSRTYRYHAVRQEHLSELENHLTVDRPPTTTAGGYRRHEMFGTPNFTASFSKQRAAPEITFFDRLLYRLIGIR